MIDWTDDDLLKQMRELGVRPNYESMLAERNRRSQERSAKAMEQLAASTLTATKDLASATWNLTIATIALALGTFVLILVTAITSESLLGVAVAMVGLFLVASAAVYLSRGLLNR